MRFYLIFIFLIFSLAAYSQSDSTKPAHNINSKQIDSAAMKRLQDSLELAAINSAHEQSRISMQSNMDYFIEMQKERRAKEKKAALLRIGIGVAFMAILIIGLRRRRKNRGDSTTGGGSAPH